MPIKLPRYVTARKKKSGQRFYFQVPKHVRPKGWPSKAIRLSDELSKMQNQAKELYARLKSERVGKPLLNYMRGSIPYIYNDYKRSEKYRGLAKTTQGLYDYCTKPILVWAADNGNIHVKHIKRPNIFKFLNAFDRNPTKKKKIYVFLRLLLQHAIDLGELDTNPALSLRLTEPDPKIHIWTPEEVELFVKKSDEIGMPEVGNAILMMYEIGQRPGDIFNMEYCNHYKDGKFQFIQSKTGENLLISATQELIKRLGNGSGYIVKNPNGGKFDKNSFGRRFKAIRNALGLTKCQFKGLRHTAVVELSRASCTPQEVASITGHTVSSVTSILRTYLPRDSKVADNAIEKREAYRKTLDSSK